MKMNRILCLLLLAVLLLTACGAKTPEQATLPDGTELTVDRSAGTVTDGKHTYRFEISGNTADYTVTVTYPNGATYYESCKNGEKVSGESENYDPETYIQGSELVSQLSGLIPQPKNLKAMLAGILLLAIGLFLVISPRKAWAFGRTAQFQNEEPSETVLKIGRLAGIAITVGAILLLVFS